MATNFGFPLVVAMLFSSLCISTFVSAEVIHFISNMPKDSPPLSIDCKANGIYVVQHSLRVGEDYEWTATINDIYYCTTMWKLFFASWHAYEPKRDVGRETVYVKIQKEGFFLSYEKSKWTKIEYWETE
ncbi:DNA topoisomerase [Actinidia chinensis var. chinensis]|uniref:DNA topoisomerase n=1 Tax=Actinidia chinensis var. chinensis TaxID=1590841 RepID=A0A2R6S0C2_ACTCC|nr:DNA topoisomerase [Actinidia chinensis var. chinensis]